MCIIDSTGRIGEVNIRYHTHYKYCSRSFVPRTDAWMYQEMDYVSHRKTMHSTDRSLISYHNKGGRDLRSCACDIAWRHFCVTQVDWFEKWGFLSNEINERSHRQRMNCENCDRYNSWQNYIKSSSWLVRWVCHTNNSKSSWLLTCTWTEQACLELIVLKPSTCPAVSLRILPC